MKEFYPGDAKRILNSFPGQTHLNIPDGVQIIREHALKGNTDIIKVTIPEGCRIIRKEAFAECTNLEEIILPDSLQVIEEYAFYNCINLKHLHIPPNVRIIGDYAFANCFSEHISVHLPDSLESLGTGVFEGTWLESVAIPNGITYIPDRFLANGAISNITFPNTLKSISKEAFLYSGLPEHLYLPDGLEEIGLRAFTDCTGLRHLYVPASINKIQRFIPEPVGPEMEDSTLQVVFYEFGSDFHDFNDKLTIHAPEGSIMDLYIQEENRWIKESNDASEYGCCDPTYIKFVPL